MTDDVLSSEEFERIYDRLDQLNVDLSIDTESHPKLERAMCDGLKLVSSHRALAAKLAVLTDDMAAVKAHLEEAGLPGPVAHPGARVGHLRRQRDALRDRVASLEGALHTIRNRAGYPWEQKDPLYACWEIASNALSDQPSAQAGGEGR